MLGRIHTFLRNQWMGALALFLVLAGGGAWAAFDPVGGDGDIDACFQKRSGDLDIRKGKKCGKGEKPVVWSQVGPQGPEGPRGPAGGGFIDLPTTAASLRLGATLDTGFGANSGIGLAAAGNSAIDLNLTLPPDYSAGTALQVQFVWLTGSTNCGVVLRPTYSSVARAGIGPLVGPSADSGFEAVGGTTLAAGGVANVSQAKEFSINSPDAGTALMPGDSVSFGVFRQGDAPADTCGDARIQGIRAVYSAA